MVDNGAWWGWVLDRIGRELPVPPPEVVQACDTVQTFLMDHSWVTAFLPVWPLVVAAGMLAAVLVAVVTIRVSRIAASAATGGGGA